MALDITGNVIEDENLGLTNLATDNDDPANPDDNVTLTTFNNTISSSLADELTALGIYPDTSTGSGTTQAIGISGDTIVSTTDQNLKLTNSTGGALNGVDTGFKAIDGNEIFLYSDPSNPDIVLGRETNSTGTVAFALLLQPTSGGATIWVVQYEALTNTNPSAGEDANTLNLSNRVYVSGSSSSISSFNIGTKNPGQNYWLPFTSSSGTSAVIVTGLDASTSNPNTVNTSSGGDGSDSQSITPGGALRFDFVSSFTGGNTKDKTFLTDSSLNIATYIEGTGASFDISQVTPTNSLINLKIIAQNESAGTFNSTETSTSTNTVAIGEIQVFNGTTLIADSARTTGNNGVTFGGTTSAPNGIVNGVTAGEKIQFTSLNGAQFDQFVVENVMPPGNTPGFDILNVTETQTLTTNDHTEVGSHIIFEDSVPTASANTQTATVDEDALAGEATGETGFGGSATGNVSNLFNAGADTPLTYALSGSTSGLPVLTSGGVAVTYSVGTAGGIDTLTAKAGTTTVFTLALTEATGAYTFTLSAPIDQETPQNGSPEGTFSFDVSGLIHATDNDGSTATAAANALKLTIIDDQPTASANTQTATVDEDALAGEATGETGFGGSATGNVSNLFNAGADTPLTYALSGSTSGLPVLTSGGVAVTYSVGTAGGIDTLTAKAGTTTVFTLALTEATGAYTFTLSAPIDQETPQNGSPEGTFSFDVSGLIHATDNDGSTATAAANALKLTITDDQPTASANTQTATVDEDALAGEATGETGFGGSATGNVSNLFNAGADTPLTYALSGSTSGLPVLTSGGVAVTYSVGTAGGIDTLTAKAGTTTVFTLALTEATGAYTFTLSAPIDQETPQNGSPEGTFSFDVSGLIHATDNDGSTATAAANALKLTIIDDQPTASANTQTATVDEDALAGEATGETGFGGSATGNVSNLFNAGADTPLTYALSGSTSGLPVLTSGGVAVTYSVGTAGGIDTLTAKAGTTTVFTLALTEATGAYTFTLSAPIDQETPQNGSPEGTFSFDVSGLIHATDKDGSTATVAGNALKLTIIDDQPTFIANSSSSGNVDEDALSANKLPDATGTSTGSTGSVSSLFAAGADVPLSFALSTDTSKLPALKSGGTSITYLVQSSGDVDTLTASAGATTVFTLALTEATGDWTFTLSAPVDQAPGANDSSQTKLDFSSLILATDADASTATAPANAWAVTVIDDVPFNFNPEAVVSADNVKDAAGSTFTGKLVNTNAADGTVDPNSSLTIKEHAGGDGFGALTFTGTNDSKLTGTLDSGSPANLQAGGKDIYLWGFGTGTLTATTDSTGQGLGGVSGSPITADEVFTITLNPDTGTYTYNMLQAISNGSNFTFSDFADVPAGNYAWFSLPFNPTTKQPVNPGKSVVFTGLNPGVDTVNPSSIGVGTDKQAVAPGKAIRLDFVDNVHSITSATALKSLSTLGYLDHYEVNNAGFALSQVSPTGKTVDIRLDAYEVPGGRRSPPGRGHCPPMRAPRMRQSPRSRS
ncbi:beta strand repeat-containing protein [Mesorhizobium sp. ORM8.1]